MDFGGSAGLVSGLKYFPLRPGTPTSVVPDAAKGSPLIICLHGASYCAAYFDIHEKNSIHGVATHLGLPVLALNRPGHGNTPQLPKAANTGTDTHLQREARWLHKFVLPMLWRAYGPPMGATSVVLMGQEMGAAVALLTASRHSTQRDSGDDVDMEYPLCGLIISGLGTNVTLKPGPSALKTEEPFDKDGEPILWHWDLEAKAKLMLNSAMGMSSPDTLQAHASICTPSLHSGALDFNSPDNFPRYWRSLASEISVPVMYHLGAFDLLWEASPQRIEEFTAAFVKSPRVESGVLRGAGHCIELSWLGPSWYVKCAGFAMGCAVEHEILAQFAQVGRKTALQALEEG